MKTILVTGCAGFIGSCLCTRLVKGGKQVVGLDNLNDYYNPSWKLENIKHIRNHEGFKFIKGDILDEKLLSSLFKKQKIGCVVHLAARAGVRPSIVSPELYEEVNVRGTLNMLEVAKNHKIKKFVFASSSSVYGNVSKVPFSENDPVSFPVSPYAATKKSGELLCYTYSHLFSLPVVCLRFFTVYGPRGRPDMAPYLFTKAIFEGQPINKFGDGTTSRDYTYIDDIIKGIISAINYRCKYEIFNLGNSHPVTLNEFIDSLEIISGKKTIIKKMPMQPGDVKTTYADIRKAEKYLGYNPQTGFFEGLKKFVKWYKKERM